jgi:hypothetical protein
MPRSIEVSPLFKPLQISPVRRSLHPTRQESLQAASPVGRVFLERIYTFQDRHEGRMPSNNVQDLFWRVARKAQTSENP